MATEQGNFLKWGDIVRIHGVNLTREHQEESKGLIISKGFTDNNIYYQKYHEFDRVNFYRESLFQVLPFSSFDLHDEMNNPNTKPEVRESLKSKVKSQIQTLQTNLKEKHGQKVPYTAEAIFRHVESHSYLKGLQKSADTGEGAFTIEVSPQPSIQIKWRIDSHRSYQKNTDPIFFDDELLIYHVFTDCYMNFDQKDNAITLDTQVDLNPLPQNHPGLQYKQTRPKIKQPNQKRTAIINENKSKCLWKFIEHCTYEQHTNAQKIKSHDIVYFQHTKNKGCISSSLNAQQYFLKETIDQKQSYECFWELIPNQVNQTGPENCNKFAARNIVTGQYLSYNGFKVAIAPKDPIEGGGFLSSGLVKLLCTEAEAGRMLQRGPLIPKDESKPEFIKFSQNLYDLYELTDVEELTKDSFLIIKVEDDTIRNIQYVISSHEHLVKFLDLFSSHMVSEVAQGKTKKSNIDKKDIPLYQFDKMNNLKIEGLENIRAILELLAGKIYGTNYAEIVSSGNTANPMIQKIIVETGTTELLIEIVYHLFIPFVFIEENPQASLDRVFRVRIAEIFERAYNLLEKIVVGNDKNKFYLSRWVDLFLLHSKAINREYIQQCLMGILQNNPKAIEATITEQKIVDLIQCFYEEASRNKSGQLTTKYLRLFSTFIKCEDRVLKQNQKIILDHFFQDKKNYFCYRFKIQTKEDVVENLQDPYSKINAKRVDIALDKQDFSPIPKYYKDWGPKWNYFLHFVNLLADVCMDKNNNAIENVSALVSLQTVTIILLDPQIEALNKMIHSANEAHLIQKGYYKYPIKNVHEPFVRIAQYVYIYNSKFTQIKTIKNISRWYRHQGEERGVVRKEDINRTKRAFEGEKEEQEQFYLNNILKYIEKFIENCNQENANLDILHTVLRLFKETVMLGLWESITQFRKLIPLLILKITKIENSKIFDIKGENKQGKNSIDIVQINKEGFSFNRPEIALNINCKIKATEIFKYINELEIDIRLRYMMNFFKGLYEATESFEDYNKVDVEAEIEDENIKTRNEKAKGEFENSEYATILGEVKKISEDQDIMLKINIWCNKFKELTPFEYQGRVDDMSKDRYLFQGEGQPPTPQNSFDAMVLSLFELPVYKNDKMLNSALRMLRSIFQQRKDLIDQLKGILICGKGSLLQVYVTLKYMREKFDMLTNQNILKMTEEEDEQFSYCIKKTYNFLEKSHAKRSGILQDLFYLSRTLKEDVNLKNIQALMYVDDGMFNKQIVFNYLNEKEKNNKLFQAVNIAEGIYLPLMSYIKLIGSNPITEVHRKILFAIYQYLALLCFNNLEGKQKLMGYIPDILPHLRRRVGAANFLYHVCLNNKMLINNQGLVLQIIDSALEACIEIDKEQGFHSLLMRDDKQWVSHTNYEKSQILFSLRGILLLNDEGYRINQELLMNRFQDNKFKRLLYKNKVEFSSRRDNFSLSPEQSYVACFFELFSVIVESKNFINIGKLENIHPYSYCLECLKNCNRWQIRRSIRSYLNRLYYVNKDRDVFLFEEFIRKEFKIINDQLDDLIALHRNKLINDELPIANGIRFKYAQSEIFEMILEIFITIQEMLLKPEFIKVLRKEIAKEERKPENQREIHDQFVKLLHHIGCLNILYPKSIIESFIREIYRHIESVMLNFNDKYLQKLTNNEGEAVVADQQDLGEDIKAAYVYDHSKSFFRNLSCMIRDIKAKKKKDEMKLKLERREKKEGSPDQLKKLYIDIIFQCQGENLKPIVSKKYREISTSLYKPHIQTANSRIFKVIAKPTLSENEENIELNRRLFVVKELIDDSPAFRKLREDEFLKLVTTVTNINETSCQYYASNWRATQEALKPGAVIGEVDLRPVVTIKEIFTKSFRLIMENHETIEDDEKIFIIKIARCYITEAVEGKQTYKLSVDKWDSDYYSGEEELPEGQEYSEFVRRQNLIKDCGGSEFIRSIFKFYDRNLDSKRELLNETLLLGIAYLFNGNTDCQESLLAVMLEDADNTMLLSIRRLINTIGALLIEIRKTKEVGRLRDFAYNIVDTYDFFDAKNNVLLKEFGKTGFDKFESRNEKAHELALCRMFRFLQLFCENGNVPMKKFLLDQTDDREGLKRKANSINFIETTTLLLRKLFKIMNDKVVGIPSNLLEFINEITQLPCIENQIAFMKSTFFEDISYLADYFMTEENVYARKFNLAPESEDEPIYQLRAIYQKGIDLALCNFEGNDDILIWEFLAKCQPKYLWAVIKQNLIKILTEKADEYGVQRNEEDSESLFETNLLARFTPDKIKQYIKEQQSADSKLNEEIQNILSVLYILRKIGIYEKGRRAEGNADKDKPKLEELEKADKALNFKKELITYVSCRDPGFPGYLHIQSFLKLFDELILSIEISSNNGKQKGLQYIYFPKHPVFKELAEQTKNSIMMGVKRETQRDKQITLLQIRSQVYEEIELNYNLKHGVITIPLINHTRPFEITSEYAGQVRNLARNISFLICFLMLFSIVVDHDTEQMTSTFSYTNFFSEFTLRVAAGLQLVTTLWFLFIWLKLRKPLALNKFKGDKGEEKKAKAELETKKKEYRELEGWDLLLAYFKMKLALFQPLAASIKQKVMKNYFVENVLISTYAISQYESGFLSILMFVVATFLGNFVGIEWYTIHLFDMFTNFPELTNIFKAIINNFKKLALLSFLAGVFILVFNVISLNTYTPVMWEQDLPEEACEDVIGCVMELYTSGAIGDDMEQFAPWRFIFDIVYVVFMEMLFQNIVGGIMIDAFSELKEEDQAIVDDKTTYCYICGMDKSTMEREGSNFIKHTKQHYLWNYLYYLYYLGCKSPTEFTGLEFQIDKKVTEDDVEWFPALGEGDTGGQVENVLKELEADVDNVFNVLDKSIVSRKTTVESAKTVIEQFKTTEKEQ